MELPISEGQIPSAPSPPTKADYLRESFSQIRLLLKQGRWHKNDWPGRLMTTLNGLSGHPWKPDIEYYELPEALPQLREVLQHTHETIQNARWYPRQFQNVVAGLEWLEGVMLGMDMPAPEAPTEDNIEGEEYVGEDFIPGSSGADCGSADIPEHFEGFNVLGEDAGAGEPSEELPASH